MATATAIKVTAERLKKLGWSRINDHMVRDLNRTLQKYNIVTPARIRHFISQCAHESGLGKWTKEIADGRLYEFRRDLGNVKPGDGPKYKGAGYLQITGRYNYQKFANEMGDQRIMEGVEYVSKNYPWSSAGYWWKMNNMNALVDSGTSVKGVTRKVNPGLRGLREREEYFRRSAVLV
ncbi:endopeptidase [Priestia megaterium]|uniref:glycoside hydrolase family 19 protein n=1 Tax=Priestia megaterium TaxID=1404 RepID=UPI00310134E5